MNVDLPNHRSSRIVVAQDRGTTIYAHSLAPHGRRRPLGRGNAFRIRSEVNDRRHDENDNCQTDSSIERPMQFARGIWIKGDRYARCNSNQRGNSCGEWKRSHKPYLTQLWVQPDFCSGIQASQVGFWQRSIQSVSPAKETISDGVSSPAHTFRLGESRQLVFPAFPYHPSFVSVSFRKKFRFQARLSSVPSLIERYMLSRPRTIM